EKILTELADLVDSPRMSRTVRQLSIPKQVHVYRRGKNTKSRTSEARQENNKYAFKLNDLKESVRFRVFGDDSGTPEKRITLVPPPALARLTTDQEEPAYTYYRLLGDQDALKGKRQLIRGMRHSTTGENTRIPVPLGSSLIITATADRDLKEPVRIA